MQQVNSFNDQFFEFININADTDIFSLLLKKSDFSKNIDFDFAILQIKCRQSTKKKLSKFISNPKFLFPTSLSAEQSTHQDVACYHASIIGSGKNVIDLTSGLGIDSLTIALENKVTAIEKETFKTDILKHNAVILGNNNIDIINDDCIEYLKNNLNLRYDVLFIDPARRDSINQRIYSISDCQPDVIKHFDLLSRAADKIIIKCSPMLDISEIIKKIPDADEIHIVCVKRECKEVLLICNNLNERFKKTGDDITIVVADIADSELKTIWKCKFSEFGRTSDIADIDDIKPQTFLYDPIAGIHKLNVSNKLCHEFSGLKKISINTDLYWSDRNFENFPGRKFEIISVSDKKSQKSFKDKQYEIVTRNYPLNSDSLAKKLKIKNGNNLNFLFGCRIGISQKPLILETIKILV